MENKNQILLGIVAVIAIMVIVLLLNNVISARVVHQYHPSTPPILYPTSVARLHCELPEPRLDLTKEGCRRIGWLQCQQMHGSPSRITTCQQNCGFEIANICRKAYGAPEYGIGIQYTYEPNLGLRRPVGIN